MTSTPVILAPDGQRARPKAGPCPQCGAGKDKRVRSSGFGVPEDQAKQACTECGHEFELGGEA